MNVLSKPWLERFLGDASNGDLALHARLSDWLQYPPAPTLLLAFCSRTAKA